jgi:hypothetical protein
MEDEVIVVRSHECPSLSGLSTLSYEYGRRMGGELVIRISANSGSGMFSNDWVPVSEVLEILRVPERQEAISSVAFRPLYLGKSVNTPSFLMAALKHEEVILATASKRNAYQVSDLAAFEERLETLPLEKAIETGVLVEVAPRKPGGKRVNNKKVTSPE